MNNVYSYLARVVEINHQPQDSQPQFRCVLVCQDRSCLRNHSDKVLAAFQAAAVPGVMVGSSGCLGQCSSGPSVQVNPDRIWYCRIKPENVPAIVEQHLKGGEPVEALLHPRLHPRLESFVLPNTAS